MSTDIIASVVAGGSNNHATVSEEANAYATDFVSAGIVGTIGNTAGASPATGGFAVNQDTVPDMGVTVNLGVAYILGTPSSQNSQMLRGRMVANYVTYVINANASGSTKYDWVYLQLSPTTAANPAASANDVITLYTSRSSSNTSDNGTPPTYGLNLAVITVANGASSITNANITDKRVQTALSTNASTNNTGWIGLGYTPNIVTYNGQRSYLMVFNGIDLTGTVSSGYRLRTTRSVAAPTQSTSLNGTNQYWNMVAPNKMTFTNNFVVSSYATLSSYVQSCVASRFDGTSGWALYINVSGQVCLQGWNGGASNYKLLTSYQSIPLNKKVQITAQLDMTASTNSPTVNYIMIDGVDVPAVQTTSGTNPTALIQAGNLQIGALNSTTPSSFFNGKIAQVAIFNAKVTQAQILTYHSQGYLGTETSLISAYSFNGVATDLMVTTPNNLTAQGSAGYTADSPFGTQASGLISPTLDYGIVQSATFSTNTTVVVQVPEGCTIPTSGGVSAVSYSGQKSPYGFIDDSSHWAILWMNKGNISAGGTSGTLNPGGSKITVPIGSWRVTDQRTPYYNKAAAAAGQMSIGIGTAATSGTLPDSTAIEYNGGLIAGDYMQTLIKTFSYTAVAQTPLYIQVIPSGSISSAAQRGDFAAEIVSLDNALL